MAQKRRLHLTDTWSTRDHPVAWSIRAHRQLILNWFEAKKEFSAGIVEGLNYKVKLTIRKAYGFRELSVAEIALCHALARLPEPKPTHEFC
ncbi:MAG: transposase [Phycisphaerales bacterium]|nr:MAG: transposase [Phycisphaerales bacterium]